MTMNLPQMGTAAQFGALRDFLAGVGYTESGICAKLGLESAETLDLVALAEDFVERVAAPEPLNTTIRLFLLGEYVPLAEAEAEFSGRSWAAMNALGLIEEDSKDSSKCFSSVALYPLGDLFIVSDRWSNPDHTPKQSFPEIVYPALTKSTREFLRFLPQSPCGHFLELCGGSGIAALTASRTALHAWTSDITERSTRFAEFNVALNGVSNVSPVEGDLFSAVNGRTFDRIAAHPPYMPLLRPAEIYYGGGEDGEQITRRILEGLKQHLNPGGRLYCRTLGTDRKETQFEQRLRSWLGNAESEFDIALFISKNLDPVRFAIDSAVRRAAGQAEVTRWGVLFERLQVQEIVTGTVVVQRRETTRRVFTIRRSLAPKANSCDTEKVLQWETEMADERTAGRVFSATPTASPRAKLLVRHQLKGSEFSPQDFTLTNDYPFLMDCKVQPWMGHLVARCDGTRTVQRLYEDSREAGWIQLDTPPGEFANVVSLLISGGFLNVD